MITVKVNAASASFRGMQEIDISGVIDETVDFFKLIPVRADQLIVNCRGVVRISSAGVRAWVNFFSHLRAHGVRLRFRDFSPPLTEINDVFRIVDVSELESVQVPLLCSSCKKTWTTPAARKGIWQSMKAMQKFSCPECGTRLCIDVGADYLHFLEEPSGTVAAK